MVSWYAILLSHLCKDLFRWIHSARGYVFPSLANRFLDAGFGGEIEDVLVFLGELGDVEGFECCARWIFTGCSELVGEGGWNFERHLHEVRIAVFWSGTLQSQF
jgi:hypothetical protein